MNCDEWIATNYANGKEKDILRMLWEDCSRAETINLLAIYEAIDGGGSSAARRIIRKRLEYLKDSLYIKKAQNKGKL